MELIFKIERIIKSLKELSKQISEKWRNIWPIKKSSRYPKRDEINIYIPPYGTKKESIIPKNIILGNIPAEYMRIASWYLEESILFPIEIFNLRVVKLII